LASNVRSISPEPESENDSTFAWVGSPGSGADGVRRITLTRCSSAASRLPVRRKKGTPRQRGLSIQSLAAT
jgi:hypothetical protein